MVKIDDRFSLHNICRVPDLLILQNTVLADTSSANVTTRSSFYQMLFLLIHT